MLNIPSFSFLARYSSDILYKYPFLEVLTGVDDGVVALVDQAHTGHVGHSVGGDVGAGNVCVPDPELLHLKQ